MNVTVRPAGDDDLPAVAALRAAWTNELAGELAGEPMADSGFAERLAAWKDGPAGHRVMWLAFAADEPIGMLNLAVFHRMPRPRRPDSRWGYIANVYVREPWRSKGVGAQLLDAAVDHARTEGYVRLVLSPSERSVPFYRRAGFTPATELLMLDLER